MLWTRLRLDDLNTGCVAAALRRNWSITSEKFACAARVAAAGDEREELMTAFGFHRRPTRRWWYAGTTLLAVAVFSVLFVASSGAVVSGSPSGFETNDGNMVLHGNSPVSNPLNGNADWNCFYGLTGATHNFQAGTADAACSTSLTISDNPTNPLQKNDIAASTTDNSWVNGQKMDTPCAQLATNKNQPKNDFTSVASYSETASNLNLYLYGATIRVAANGNASENVELNKLPGTNSCPINRSEGDKLLAFDYLNGGTSLNLHVLTWVATSAGYTDPITNQVYSGSCIIGNDTAPCWSATVVQPSPSTFEGQVSQAAIAANANAMNGQALVAGQFAEFGVNITNAIYGGSVGCTAFAQTTWESRSAGSSFSSNPEDISIENTSVTNCGEVKIIKNTSPRGTDKWFSYTTSGSSLSSFRLNDKSAISISSISAANPAVIATATAHGLTTGDMVTIAGSNSTPAIDGTWVATVVDSTHFSIPLAVTTAGTAGTVTFNTEDFTNVLPGAKTVTETVPSGWTLTGLTCSTGGTTSGAISTITVTAGSVVTCTYTNTPSSATLATSVAAGPVTPGTAVSDTATVTGSVQSVNPGGDVTFYLCSFATGSTSVCDGTTNAGTSIGAGTLGNGSGGVSTASSPTVNDSTQTAASGRGTLTAGRYCFRAEWPGDTNYPGAKTEYSAATECFTVSKIGTGTVTTPNIGGVTKATITLGSTIVDTAVVTGTSVGGDPTGKVVFHVCALASGTCTSAGDLVGDATGVDLQSDGVLGTYTSSATSAGFKPTATGRYCFRGDYGGSTIYNSSSDSNSNECFTVTDTTTASSTQNWVPNDVASVSSKNGATLQGTLSVQLYSGDNCGATSGSAVGNPYSATASGTTATVTTTNTTAYSGDMSWLVTFTSTDSNVSGSSHCEHSTVTITD
jgi:hypothetical protein